jgi:hypothetical protein
MGDINYYETAHRRWACDNMWTCRWEKMLQENILPASLRLKLMHIERAS